MILEFILGVKEGQERFGGDIASIINFILLTVVYVLGVGLTSLFGKMVAIDFFKYGNKSKKNSYWGDLNLGKRKKEDYYRQF